VTVDATALAAIIWRRFISLFVFMVWILRGRKIN